MGALRRRWVWLGRKCGCVRPRVGAAALCLRQGEMAATRCLAAVVRPAGEEGACVISRVIAVGPGCRRLGSERWRFS